MTSAKITQLTDVAITNCLNNKIFDPNLIGLISAYVPRDYIIVVTRKESTRYYTLAKNAEKCIQRFSNQTLTITLPPHIARCADYKTVSIIKEFCRYYSTRGLPNLAMTSFIPRGVRLSQLLTIPLWEMINVGEKQIVRLFTVSRYLRMPVMEKSILLMAKYKGMDVMGKLCWRKME